MCRKNEVNCSFIHLLHYFYHGIECDKTCDFVNRGTFEVRSNIKILKLSLNIGIVQFASNFLTISAKLSLDDSLNLCTSSE